MARAPTPHHARPAEHKHRDRAASMSRTVQIEAHRYSRRGRSAIGPLWCKTQKVVDGKRRWPGSDHTHTTGIPTATGRSAGVTGDVASDDSHDLRCIARRSRSNRSRPRCTGSTTLSQLHLLPEWPDTPVLRLSIAPTSTCRISRGPPLPGLYPRSDRRTVPVPTRRTDSRARHLTERRWIRRSRVDAWVPHRRRHRQQPHPQGVEAMTHAIKQFATTPP
jgi:hypothetical protein